MSAVAIVAQRQRATLCHEARALRAQVGVPVGSDARGAVESPRKHTTRREGHQTMAKKAAKGGKKKGGKKR